MRESEVSLGNRATHIGWVLLASAAVAALLPIMARGVIDHVVIYDELLHILAARGLLDTGLPAIADGIYERGELYTRLVAIAMGQVGDTPVAARLPALAAGTLLVFLLTMWVSRKAGMLAGASAGVFLCMVPGTVDAAVFARFYTLHAVVMLVMFAAAFEACVPGKSNSARIVWSILAFTLLPLGWHLQETTLIGAAAAAAGVVVVLAISHWKVAKDFVWSHAIAVLASILGLAGIGLIVLGELGFWAEFARAPLWSAGRAHRHHYYFEALSRELPLLWPLLPAAVVLGVCDARTRRIVGFAATILIVSLLVHSFAGSKAVRYVYYVMPLACMAWGIAAANVVARFAACDDPVAGTSQVLRRWAAPILMIVGMALSQEGIRMLRLASGRLEPAVALGYGTEADWGPAMASLHRSLRSADVVVTSNSMKALFFLGRYDYELNASIVAETDTGQEFGVDRRTGRRVIGTARSLERVLAMPGSVLIVLELEKMGKPSGVPADAVAVIESRCQANDHAAWSGLRAWTCARDPAP